VRLANRVRRLESVSARSRTHGPSPAEILRERQRRHSAEIGQAYIEPAPINFTDARGRPLSVAEILRVRRRTRKG
jgi:hypothetical protein